jgi:DNA invertase Pin-like site-specific DNA recombinase
MERNRDLKERELRRFQVLSLYEKEVITYLEAAEAMGVSVRQFWRLRRRYREGSGVAYVKQRLYAGMPGGEV